MTGTVEPTFFYRKVLSPLCAYLQTFIPVWITPNQITLLGGFFSAISTYLQLQGEYLFAALFLVIYDLADNIDGKHARATKQSSKFGSVLDHAVDGTFGCFGTTLCLSRFIGLPWLVVARVMFACFAGIHQLESATGHLKLGFEFFGPDETILSVVGLLILEHFGFSAAPTLAGIITVDQIVCQIFLNMSLFLFNDPIYIYIYTINLITT